MDPSNLSPSARQAFKLIEFDKDEKLLLEIRKHPFGLFIIYLIGTFVTVSMLAISFAVAFARGDVLGIGVAGSSNTKPTRQKLL